jgi:hypothetical protein
MQFASTPVLEQCQYSPSAYSRCTRAGYERKDSGEREYKQATLPLRKTVWGNPQKLGGIKNTAARVSSESREVHGKVGIITRVCKHVHTCIVCSVSNCMWPARTSIEQLHQPSFPFGVQYTCSRSISPPTTALRLRSFLADLLGGAALWAVSADTGKRVLSPQRRFPAGSAVWILRSC